MKLSLLIFKLSQTGLRQFIVIWLEWIGFFLRNVQNKQSSVSSRNIFLALPEHAGLEKSKPKIYKIFQKNQVTSSPNLP